jgi:hypothetical protein
MSAPPIDIHYHSENEDDVQTDEEELQCVGDELVAHVSKNRSPQISPVVEIGRAKEIQALKQLASNKISDQIALIVDRFERERYLLLQRYQERLAVIHDREKKALKDFVSGITFNSSRQTRTDIIDKIASYYTKIRSITNI